MYLRKRVIRHSVGIFKCDNITEQRRGITWNPSTQHAISKLYFCKLYYSPGHYEKILHLLCVYSRPQPQISRLAQEVKSSSYRNNKQPSVISKCSQVLKIYKSKLYFTRLHSAGICSSFIYLLYKVSKFLSSVFYILISIRFSKKSKVGRKQIYMEYCWWDLGLPGRILR